MDKTTSYWLLAIGYWLLAIGYWLSYYLSFQEQRLNKKFTGVKS